MNAKVSNPEIPGTLKSRIIQVTTENIENNIEQRIEFRPVKPLENIIEHIWYRTSFNVKIPGKYRWIVPGGNINIIFPLKGQKKQSAYIVSSITRAAMVKLEGVQEFIGVRFCPGGYGRIFSFPIQELETYYTWDLADIFPGVHILENRLREHISLAKKIGYVESFLIRNITTFQPPPIVMTVLSHIIQSRGNIPISLLAGKCDLSQRQLQRTCLSILGVTPYTYCRVIKFLYACLYMHMENINFAQLAYTLGYSDQSHFIREFKKLSQYTPIEFLKNTEKKIIGYKTKLYATSPVQDPHTLL